MPFKYQILVTPLTMILLLTRLVWFTLGKHGEIDEQNEVIKQWGRITDHLQIAIAAGERLKDLSLKLQNSPFEKLDELSFTYLELTTKCMSGLSLILSHQKQFTVMF